MQRSLTKGPITGSILLFALPLMLAYLLSATPMGVTGIWLSVPIGWALADAIGIGYSTTAVCDGSEKAGIDNRAPWPNNSILAIDRDADSIKELRKISLPTFFNGR